MDNQVPPAPAWLEASVNCSGELAEAVAEVFSRYAPGGVCLHSITRFNQLTQEEEPTGQMHVVAYLEVGPELEATRQKLNEGLWHLGQIVPLPEAEYRLIADQNWMEAWKEHYRPLKIGRSLMVLPAWVDPQLAEGRIPLIISPDMAFGTGTHPSTQLCLLALEKYGCQGLDLIDIGCGSGILSIAGKRLGAAEVLGVDNDPITMPSCERNAELNGMAGQMRFEVGTHTDVLLGRFGLKATPRVMANILAPILLAMMQSGLAETLLPGGLLIMGGILKDQAESVAEEGREHGLELVDALRDEDWIVLVMKRPED